MLTRRASYALALAAVVAVGAARAQPTPTETVRPAIAAPLQAGIELLKAGQFAEALAKAAEAEAVADRTPYENFVLDQLRAGAAAGAGDGALAVRSYEAVLAAGRLDAAESLKIVEALVGTSYRLQDYGRSVRWAQRYLADGGANPQVRRLLANALIQQADWPAAAAQLTALAAADEAAGRAPAEDLLRLLASSHGRMKTDAGEAGYVATLERLLRHHPKPEYWRDRLLRLQNQASFDEALMIDSLRLQRATGALRDAAEYTEFADLSLRAGLPAEAKQVLDAGFAAGVLGSGANAAAHAELRARATRLAEADARLLDEPADASASADALVAQGLAQATAGRAERGAALIAQGLAQGGVAQPGIARLRAAWVAVLAGQAEPAQAAFESLASSDPVPAGVADLARLWRLHLAGPRR